ncbi:hypothetical protein TNCV_653731 [Trichonephila clavipes]|nr:hypothetical protein TNCV_653731 [Trichonephila clavipes]
MNGHSISEIVSDSPFLDLNCQECDGRGSLVVKAAWLNSSSEAFSDDLLSLCHMKLMHFAMQKEVYHYYIHILMIPSVNHAVPVSISALGQSSGMHYGCV